MTTPKVQVSVRVPAGMTAAIDEFVDGVTYQSRGQVFLVAMAEWLRARDIDWQTFDMPDPRQLDLDSVDTDESEV